MHLRIEIASARYARLAMTERGYFAEMPSASTILLHLLTSPRK
jgi:hypothetical protein